MKNHQKKLKFCKKFAKRIADRVIWKSDNTMIDKIDNSQIQDSLEKLTSKQPSSAGAALNNDAAVSLQLNYASFIDEAIQTQQTDTNAVQKAQKLLLSGQLESPENVREAAENLVELGI